MEQPHTPDIDQGFALTLGRELRQIREARAQSVEQVAASLLLSTRQVRAIEEADTAPFYSPLHYQTAARKYALSLDVRFEPGRLLPEPDEAQLRQLDEMIRQRGRTVRGVLPGMSGGLGFLKLALPGAALVGVLAALMVESGRMPDAAPLLSWLRAAPMPWRSAPSDTAAEPVAAKPAAARPAAAAPIAAAPIAAPARPATGSQVGASAASQPPQSRIVTAPPEAASRPVDGATVSAKPDAEPAVARIAVAGGPLPVDTPSIDRSPSDQKAGEDLRLEFSGRSWVQVVHRDGQRYFKTFEANDSLALRRADLQALVIGNAANTTLLRAGRRIDLAALKPDDGKAPTRLIGERLRRIGD